MYIYHYIIPGARLSQLMGVVHMYAYMIYWSGGSTIFRVDRQVMMVRKGEHVARGNLRGVHSAIYYSIT